MSFKRILLPYIILLSALMCLSGKFKKESYPTENLPGVIKIDENLFMDLAELNNEGWREYMYWVSRVFGDSSKEHLATFPNDMVWMNYYEQPHFNYNYLFPCTRYYFQDYYLGHPQFKNHPVVGITKQQAKDYCLWRSERVFEQFLIKNKVLDHQPDQGRDNHFSFKNYFGGKFNNTPPDPRFKQYPLYRLPTQEEWLTSKSFFVQNDRKEIRNCTKKSCWISIEDKTIPNTLNIQICAGDSLIESPLKGTYCQRNSKVSFYIDGNASEWLNEEDYFIGSNWRDSSHLYSDSLRISEKPTDFIGFRCVAEIKTWEFE